MPVRESTDQKGTHPQGGAAAPGPRGVWAVAPAVSTPHCLRGTRQDLPCTSARNPAPEFEPVETRRATHMPHTRVLDGQSRSLTRTDPAVYLVRYCCSSHGRPRDRSSKLVIPLLHTRGCRPVPRCVWLRSPRCFTPYRPTRTRQNLPCTSAGSPAPRVRSSGSCPLRARSDSDPGYLTATQQHVAIPADLRSGSPTGTG